MVKQIDWDYLHKWFFESVQSKGGKGYWKVCKSANGPLLQSNFLNADPETAYTSLVDYLSSILKNGQKVFAVGVISNKKDRYGDWFPIYLSTPSQGSNGVAIAGHGDNSHYIGQITKAKEDVLLKELKWQKKWSDKKLQDKVDELNWEIQDLKSEQKKDWEKILDIPIVSAIASKILGIDLPAVGVAGANIIDQVPASEGDDDEISEAEQMLLHYRTLLFKQGVKDVDIKLKKMFTFWINNPIDVELMLSQIAVKKDDAST